MPAETIILPQEELTITQEWDNVHPKVIKRNIRKLHSLNRYGITLVTDVYIPKDAKGSLPAIAVAGPFGAVKDHSSGLFAQEKAERGF